MAALTVGTEPVAIDGLGIKVCLIQNLGPGTVYMDATDDVSPETGFQIGSGAVFETSGSGGNSTIFLVAEQDTEVRVVSI